mgnify:CR=1 FL=1
MEKQKYSLIFKIISWVLMLVSIAVVVWGFIKGYPDKVVNDNGTVDPLLYWTYIMIGLAIVAVIIVGLIISLKNNPKSLLKMALLLVGAAVLVGIAYVTASGAPAVGFTGSKLPTDGELKLTDTVLNLTYILGAAAILSIIAGEIIMSVRNKK